MRKLTLPFSLLVFAFTASFLLVTPVFAVDSELDQSCVSTDPAAFWRVDDVDCAQTFMPSLNRLTGVKLTLKGDGAGTVKVEIYQGDDLVAASDPQDEPTGLGTTYFPLGNVVVTPGDGTYKIVVVAVEDEGTILWNFAHSCYDAGRAILNGSPQGFDFGFATYGYNSITVIPGLLSPAGEDDDGTGEGEEPVDDPEEEDVDEDESNGDGLDEDSSGEGFGDGGTPSDFADLAGLAGAGQLASDEEPSGLGDDGSSRSLESTGAGRTHVVSPNAGPRTGVSSKSSSLLPKVLSVLGIAVIEGLWGWVIYGIVMRKRTSKVESGEGEPVSKS